MSDIDIELGQKSITTAPDVIFEFMTNNVEEVQEEDIELSSFCSNIEINPTCIDIEITGLKGINKFIGLEDTPLYYENGKFFKVENNRIVYTDIQWGDITGNFEDNKDLTAKLNELSNEIIEVKITVNKIVEEEIPNIKENITVIENNVENNYQLIQEVTPKWGSIEDLLNN